MASKDYSDMEITDEEFNSILNSSNSHKLIVVDFFAEWCMPCLLITPIIDELSEKMPEIKFVKINVDDNQGLAQKYKVSSIPCLIIFKEGKEVSRIIGNQPQEIIEDKIKSYL